MCIRDRFVIDHDFDRRSKGDARIGVLAELIQDGVRARSVVDYAEGIDQVVGLDRDEGAQLFGVAGAKADAVLQAEDAGALAGEGHGFIGEIDGGDLGAVTREVDGVGADAAADFEDLFSAPALEVCKGGNVGLDQIFAGFDLVEIFFRAYRLCRVTDVAGTVIPVVPDAI